MYKRQAFSLFKVGAICQGILGRVRDGTASSKHAEERGMKVYPLSQGAWSIVENNLNSFFEKKYYSSN